MNDTSWPPGIADRYLSPRTLREVSEILRGLAQVLERTDGVWGDDAREDAARLRGLVDEMDAWCRHWRDVPDADTRRPGRDHGVRWTDVLALYLR